MKKQTKTAKSEARSEEESTKQKSIIHVNSSVANARVNVCARTFGILPLKTI